jgi:hypothetical protein
MEVEVRDSDFMTMATAKELVTTEIEVYLDKPSVIQALQSKDITMGARVEIQLVSSHKKSVRQRKSFILEEFNFK